MKPKKPIIPKAHKAQVPVISKPARDYSLLVTALFFCVALAGILHHEMWRDEYQAFLVARDSHSPAELLQNTKYEGHPLLWYILLYALTFVTSNPIFLQLLNLAFGTAAVYVFCRKSPFSTMQKVLFPFGYYTLYEFTLITRYHALALLILVLFCALYEKRNKNFLWLSLLLFLLANVSLMYNVIAIALFGMMAADYLIHHKKAAWAAVSKATFGAGAIFVLSGIVLSAWQVMPENDNMVRPSVTNLLNGEWMMALISRIDNAYLLFRDVSTLPTWMAIGWIKMSEENIPLHVMLSLGLLALASLCLLRKPLALLYYWAGTAGLLVIYGVSFLTASRYMGGLYLVFITSLWLSDALQERAAPRGPAASFANWGSKIKMPLLLFVFAFQLAAAAAFYITDLERPFSASKDAADYIREQHLDTLPVFGTRDFIVSPLSALLNKPVYYPEIRKTGSFIVWSGMRDHQIDFSKAIPQLDTLLSEKNQKILVITNYKIMLNKGGETVPLEHSMLSGSLKMDLLKHFEKSMVEDEIFSLYLVERMK